MDLNQEFSRDEKLEVEGVWEDFQDDSKVKIARIGNKNWRRESRRLPRSVRRQMREDVLGERELDEITAELMAKTVLLDWEGFTLNGAELDYSQAAAKEMLLKFPDFRERVFELANDAAVFKAQVDIDLGKDSNEQ